MRKHKILIIGPGMEIGGVERSLIGLLDSLDYTRVDVDLYLFSHTGELMEYINPKVNLLHEEPLFALGGWPIGRLFRSGHFVLGGARTLAKITGALREKFINTDGAGSINVTLCKKWLTHFVKPLVTQYDMALGFFGPHYFLESKVNAKIKIGWVHTDYGNVNEKQDKAFMLPMWSGLDRIACVSDGVKKSFDAIYPSLKEKTIVIENMLPQSFVRSQSRLDYEKVKDEMPEDGSFRILTVGRFSTAKNYPGAIEACSRLREAGIPATWYFIGYGPMETRIKRLIHEKGAEGYVKNLGKKTNPYPYMAECDLYAQPSLYEGKAVTVREAQMLGKPVLITNFATAHSQLENGVDGHICPLTVDGIMEGIQYMMDHPEYRSKLAENAKSRDYSGSSETEKIYNLIP